MSELFMSGAQVGDFIRHFALGRANFQNTNEIMDNLIDRMASMRDNALDAERAFYVEYKVNSLKELQNRLNLANEDNAIRSMQNKGIRESAWGKEVVEGGLTTTEALTQLNKGINKIVESEGLDYEAVVNIVTTDMTEYFNEQGGVRATSNTKSKGGKKTLIKKSILKQNLLEALKEGKNFSQTYSRDLKTYLTQSMKSQTFKATNEIGEVIEFQIPVNISDSNHFPRQIPMRPVNGYPYFNLTPEDQKFAMEANSVSNYIWESFKDFMSEGSLYSNYIKDCMEVMGREIFIRSGDSFGKIAGILGELQTMAFITILTNGIIPKHTAPDLNISGKQLNIDVLLSNFGFQVKNYKEYNGTNGMGHHIKDSLSWSQLDSRLGEDSAYDIIKQFYITQAFNQPNYNYQNLSTFKDYQSFYQNYLNQKGGSVNNAINAYMAGYLDKLIPLRTMLEISGVETLQSNTVFWLLSGKTIVPTSAICSALIDRLNTFRQQLANGDKTTFRDFRINTISSYPKDKIWNGEKTSKDINYGFVEQTLSGLRFDFNIYLSDFQKYLDQSKLSN